MGGSKHCIVARVGESGKLNLPSQLRKMIGLEKGGPVVIRFEGDALHLRTMRSVLEELQDEAATLFAGSGESIAQFLADRRTEAAAEDGEEERR